MRKLLTHRQVDRLLLYPQGRTLKLAKSGHIPFIVLPDGEIRFDEAAIEKLLTPAGATQDDPPAQEALGA